MTRFWLERAIILMGASFLGAVAAQSPDQEAPTEPLELGIKEQIDVRLVLVDFLALDRDGRTVPDLTTDELLLMVDSKDKKIASLDRDCPLGAADDAQAGAPEDQGAAPAPTRQPRQMVLVFDYYHMASVAETLEAASAMLERLAEGDEQHMVVSLGEVVRIESPFTTDLDEVRWALARMRDDPDLYAGNYGRLTERRFYERIKVLFDLLEAVPGRKSIVLFSGPFMPDGFNYDPTYKELSALSTTARTAVYPVDTQGLSVSQPLGGPPRLRRLANETGGRMTSDTNDITLGYARAHRDLGCTYTLGFYDQGPRLDRERRITIRPLRRGVRIVYPEYYVVRSPEEKRASLFRTASMAPHMFESPAIATNVFILGPRSGQRWRTLFSVEIHPGTDPLTATGEDEEWTLKGFLRRTNGTVVHSFERQVRLPAADPADDTPPSIRVFQEIAVPPGRYIASAIVSGPEGQEPWAKTRPVELSEIPRDAPFLIGPILGQSTGVPDDPGVPSAGFEPLMAAQTRQGDPLDSLTLFCRVGATEPLDLGTITRTLLALDGAASVHFEPTAVQLPGDGKTHCHPVLDRLSTLGLLPGRYEMTVVREGSNPVTGSGSTEFTVLAPGAEGTE